MEQKFRPIKKNLEEVIASGILEPKAVYGYFPAQSDGNDTIVYDAEDHTKELLRFASPRQREGRKLSISDFFWPKSSGKMDVIGLSPWAPVHRSKPRSCSKQESTPNISTCTASAWRCGSPGRIPA